MKIVKGILYFLLIVIAVFLIAALFAPAEKTVERSITINAPASAVYSQIANFENWKNWDPWFKRDTTQVRTYNGTLGDESYSYSWKSDNEKVGNGMMTMDAFEENMSTSNHITMGDEGKTMEMDAGFKLEADGEATKVTWNMVSKLGFPWKIMHYMTEKWVGPDYEKGLANLKEYVESNPQVESAIEVEMLTEKGVNYAVVKETISFNDFDAFFGSAYGAIYEYLGKNGVQPMGNPSALYYTWDTINKQTEVAAAVPISDAVTIETKLETIDVGEAAMGSNSISYTMVGNYDGSEAAHNALGAWIAKNNKTYTGPVIEEYIKGPSNESDPSKYVTKISYYFE